MSLLDGKNVLCFRSNEITEGLEITSSLTVTLTKKNCTLKNFSATVEEQCEKIKLIFFVDNCEFEHKGGWTLQLLDDQKQILFKKIVYVNF